MPTRTVPPISIPCAPMSDEELMHLALNSARNSPDPSTQNGAILARHDGIPILPTATCNFFPFGIAYTPERWERPLKYSIIEHAERNAIYAAARHGIATVGLTMACGWAACADCARAIIQARIAKLITLAPIKDETNSRWDASIDVAMGMLDEAKVEVVYLDGKDFSGHELRRDGKPWSPC